MTHLQAAQLVTNYGATFVVTKDGIEWWRLQDRSWLALKKYTNGTAEVRQLPANACGC